MPTQLSNAPRGSASYYVSETWRVGADGRWYPTYNYVRFV